MLKKQSFWITSFLVIFLISCQTESEQLNTKIPVTHENLSVDQLVEKSSLPIKLPTTLPFEPVDILITHDDYKDLHGNGGRVEEIQVRYIKTDREGRYIDVTISNFGEESEQGETVLLENGTEAIFAEDEIGQLLFWTEGDVNYRLIYYTSTKVNEGQEPLSLEEFIAIANSFEPIKQD